MLGELKNLPKYTSNDLFAIFRFTSFNDVLDDIVSTVRRILIVILPILIFDQSLRRTVQFL